VATSAKAQGRRVIGGPVP